MLRNIFIPLVDSFGLSGSKALNYSIFKEAMIIYSSGEYKTDDGLRKIIESVYSLSEGSKGRGRKFTLKQYLQKYKL